MELKTLADIDEVVEHCLTEKHAVIILSDGKMQLANLPAYGDVQLVCKDKKAKRIKVITDKQL